MAALFDLDTEREATSAGPGVGGGGVVGEAFEVIAAHLLELPGPRAICEIEAIRGRLDAVEAQVLGGYIDANGDTTKAENLAGSTGASKKTRERRARRAKAVKKNPNLGDKLATGELSGEKTDIIAAADADTAGAAGQDAGFIDKVAAAGDADQAARIARDYVTAHGDAAKAQSRHDRQRRRRCLSRFVTDDGLDAIMAKGDTESMQAVWNTLVGDANALYNTDGGRDLPGSQHPRTFNQRLYDALVARVTGQPPTTSATPAGAAASKAAAPADAETSNSSGHQDDTSQGTVAAATTCGCRGPIATKRYTPAKARPVIVVGVTLGKYLGLDPDAAAEQIGVGPIADSVLAQYLDADPEIIGALYGRDGEPLWWGPAIRYATDAQVRALIMRDKGCVGCGTHYLHCQAHHLKPWNAPIRGHTDITNLALLCGDCHRHLHAHNHTLYRHHDGTWRTRPATANETPPQRATPPARH